MPGMGRSFDIAEFSASDGFTPRQTAKLNANTRRIVGAISAGAQGNAISEADVRSIADRVVARVADAIFDEFMPVGTIIMVESMSKVPRLGTWAIETSYAGRYLRADATACIDGGRAKADPLQIGDVYRHRHHFGIKTARVAQDAGGVEVVAGIGDYDGSAYPTQVQTSYSGSSSMPSGIDLDPRYRTVIIAKRIA